MLDNRDFDVDWDTARLPLVSARPEQPVAEPISAPTRTHRGRRAVAAARERSLALKGLAAAGVLVVAVWAGFAGVSAAKTLFARPSTTSSVSAQSTSGDSTTQTTAKKAARRTAAKHVAHANGSGSATSAVSSAGGGSAPAKMAPVRVASAATVRTTTSSASTSPRTTSKKSPAKSKRKPRAPTVASKGTVTIETFGYSFAPPPKKAVLVADVRNIQAGNFSQSENGLMASVRKRVMAVQAAKDWLGKLETNWTPQLKNGELVAVGCARGHHRSVTIAYLYAQYLRAHGWKVNLVHRDINKTW